MTTPVDTVELVRIASGLEDEGRYLAARLFRAAARSEGSRRARTHPRSNNELAAAIDAIIPRLRDAGHRAALLAAMTKVAGMLRAGDERFEGDTAELHLCRSCGDELIGEMPEACPTCGNGALSFERVLPIYFLDPVPTEPLIAALGAFPDRVAMICDGLTEAGALTGEWPAREILSHLVGAQGLLGGRIIRTLDEDEPELRSVTPTSVIAAADQRPGATELLAQLRSQRDALLTRVAGLSAEQWRRLGHHGEWGPMTVQQQLGYIARHEQSHLGHLRSAVGRP